MISVFALLGELLHHREDSRLLSDASLRPVSASFLPSLNSYPSTMECFVQAYRPVSISYLCLLRSEGLIPTRAHTFRSSLTWALSSCPDPDASLPSPSLQRIPPPATISGAQKDCRMTSDDTTASQCRSFRRG